MDIILDSNQYIPDFRLATNKFSNLFEYLRRTGSALLIPTMVQEEVIAKYRKFLRDSIATFAGSWNSLDGYLQRGLGERPRIDIDDQCRRLSERLKLPAKGVRTLLDLKFSGVDVDEVVRRGVHRIRPASSGGEELRDVALWLFALGYAKKVGAPIAFVARDNGFFAEGQIHPQIARDIENAKCAVMVFRDLEDFNRSTALQKRPATPDDFRKLDLQPLEPAIKSLLISALASTANWQRATVTDIQLQTFSFKEGLVYSISPSVDFAELRLAGTALAQVEQRGFYQNYVNYVNYDAKVGNILFESKHIPLSILAGKLDPLNLSNSYKILYPNEPGTILNATPPWIDWMPTGGGASPVSLHALTLNFGLSISARLKGKTIEDLEIDHFNLSDILLVPETTTAVPSR